MSLVVRVWWCFCGVLCCLGGWWGPLVDVDDAPVDFDAEGVMVCGVAVSTLGWGPGGAGGAGGVCSPAVVAPLVLPLMGAP